MFCAPLVGWRHIQVTERRTRVDWAYAMRDVVDVYFPTATKIRVVSDNLNTHDPGSLYEAFAPEEARRILDRLELHHTPKHGRWLNMAEIELSVLGRQCLDRRIPDHATLAREVAAWEPPALVPPPPWTGASPPPTRASSSSISTPSPRCWPTTRPPHRPTATRATHRSPNVVAFHETSTVQSSLDRLLGACCAHKRRRERKTTARA